MFESEFMSADFFKIFFNNPESFDVGDRRYFNRSILLPIFLLYLG